MKPNTQMQWILFCSNRLIGLMGLILCTSACVRGGFKSDKEFYEETGEGYYRPESAAKPGTPTQTLERLKQPRKKVLILGFWNDSPVGDSKLGDFAADELKRELLVRKRILLPEEKSITSVTKDFVDGDRVQVSQLIREGRRVGVSTVILGRISKIVFRQDREEVGLLREAQSSVAVDVEMKVFDVAAGREVHATKRSGGAVSTAKVIFEMDALSGQEARAELSREALQDAVQKLIPDALMSLEKMDWQGRVAKILGNKVYINAGRASGLLSGDILKVTSPGEEIIDPVTRSFLGRAEGFLKGTLEVTEFIGEDSSMTLIHTGGNFQEGDVVRLY
jgi:hypothetical protein